MGKPLLTRDGLRLTLPARYIDTGLAVLESYRLRRTDWPRLRFGLLVVLEYNTGGGGLLLTGHVVTHSLAPTGGRGELMLHPDPREADCPEFVLIPAEAIRAVLVPVDKQPHPVHALA